MVQEPILKRLKSSDKLDKDAMLVPASVVALERLDGPCMLSAHDIALIRVGPVSVDDSVSWISTIPFPSLSISHFCHNRKASLSCCARACQSQYMDRCML